MSDALVRSGDSFVCPRCKKTHLLEPSRTEDGKPGVLLFYRCGPTAFLGAVEGKLVIAQKTEAPPKPAAKRKHSPHMDTIPENTDTKQVRKPFAIDKGIPCPTGTLLDRFPFAQMEIGDSFLVPKGEMSENTARSYLSRYAKDKKDVAYRAFAAEGGIRIWRVEPKKAEEATP